MINRRLLLLVCCGIYFLVLNYSYATVESQIFGYDGYRYTPLSPEFLLLSFILAVLPALWLPIRIQRPSEVAYWILYLTVVVPCLIVPYHVISFPPERTAVLCIVVTGLFGLLRLFQRIPLPHFSGLRLPTWPVIAGLLLLVAATIGLAMSTEGFRFTLSFEDVYDRRAIAREEFASYSLAAYLLAIVRSSAGPLLIAIGTVRRNTALVAAGWLALLIIFGFDGTKSSFFVPFLLLALFVLERRLRSHFGLVAAGAGIAVVLVSLYMFHSHDDIFWSSLFVRRSILTKGQLSAFYWEYFSTHPHSYYSHSFLQGLLAPVYDRSAGPLIGREYWGSETMNATANFWASGFAEAGYAGMVVVTLLVGGLFLIFDAVGRGDNFRTAVLMAGLLGHLLSNGSVERGLVSHGGLLTLAVLIAIGGWQKAQPRTTEEGALTRSTRTRQAPAAAHNWRNGGV